MFSYSGSKVKIFAIASFIVKAVLSLVVAALILGSLNLSFSFFGARLELTPFSVLSIIVSIAVLACGVLLSYASSLERYSYGDLLEQLAIEYDPKLEAEAEEKEAGAEEGEAKRSSIEILKNLYALFETARHIDEDEKMVSFLQAGCEGLPDDEKAILSGIMQHTPADVREIMRDFLELHTEE